jgi:hypothetical protein
MDIRLTEVEARALRSGQSPVTVRSPRSKRFTTFAGHHAWMTGKPEIKIHSMKNTISSAFVAASAAVILWLGLLHLLYTFRGPELHPRDPDLTAKMTTVSPVISQETTMWRLWVGFNATHSFGLLLFGALYGYLAMRHSAFLLQSWFLLALGFALLLGYAVIARLYFFTAPFRGVVLAAVLFLLGIVVNRA